MIKTEEKTRQIPCKNSNRLTAPFTPIHVRTGIICAYSISQRHDSHWNVLPLLIIYITLYFMLKKRKKSVWANGLPFIIKHGMIRPDIRAKHVSANHSRAAFNIIAASLKARS